MNTKLLTVASALALLAAPALAQSADPLSALSSQPNIKPSAPAGMTPTLGGGSGSTFERGFATSARLGGMSTEFKTTSGAAEAPGSRTSSGFGASPEMAPAFAVGGFSTQGGQPGQGSPAPASFGQSGSTDVTPMLGVDVGAAGMSAMGDKSANPNVRLGR